MLEYASADFQISLKYIFLHIAASKNTAKNIRNALKAVFLQKSTEPPKTFVQWSLVPIFLSRQTFQNLFFETFVLLKPLEHRIDLQQKVCKIRLLTHFNSGYYFIYFYTI
jgi:hypothetical protein